MTASLYQSLSSCGANDCSPSRIPAKTQTGRSLRGSHQTRPHGNTAFEPQPAIRSNVLEKCAPEAPTDSNPQNFAIRAKRNVHPSTNHEPDMTLPILAPVPSRQH